MPAIRVPTARPAPRGPAATDRAAFPAALRRGRPRLLTTPTVSAQPRCSSCRRSYRARTASCS
eukprot:9461245-Alexandrium_andersonii.AAC.1